VVLGSGNYYAIDRETLRKNICPVPSQIKDRKNKKKQNEKSFFTDKHLILTDDASCAHYLYPHFLPTNLCTN
jgi:hypothetical protein